MSESRAVVEVYICETFWIQSECWCCHSHVHRNLIQGLCEGKGSDPYNNVTAPGIGRQIRQPSGPEGRKRHATDTRV
jgi:hypothetical protein